MTKTQTSAPAAGDIVAAARDKIPGYRDVCTKIDRLRIQTSTMLSPQAGRSGSPADVALDQVLASLESDTPSSLAELTEATMTAMNRAQASEAIGNALTQARAHLVMRRDETLINGSDTVLSALNKAMVEISDQAAKLEPLTQIETPEAAFASTRLDDGAQLQVLLVRYEAIRGEQMRIMRERLFNENVASKSSIVAFINNVEDVFDQWGPWIQHGYLENRRSPEQRPINPPWPGPNQGHRAAFGLWALTNRAHLWVPTIGEYTEAVEELRYKARQTRKGADAVRDGDWWDPSSIPRATRRGYQH